MTQKNRSKERYQQSLLKTIDYIHNNLDNTALMQKVPDIACFSPYHWHRIYHGLTNETLGQTIRRLRLQRAAKALISSNTPLRKIARTAHYENTDSFIRSFSQHFNTPPIAYRKRGEWLITEIKKSTQGDPKMYTVTIKELPALKLAVIEHQGSYLKIGQAFEKVFAISHQHNLLHNNTRAFGIYYDNPNEIPEKDLRAKAGITISDEDNPETGLSITTTASGKYATMIHTGAYSELENAYQWLYGVWLINSDEEPANAPVLEEYLNNPREVPAHQLKTAIYLPLK